jgi:hypothetical protein
MTEEEQWRAACTHMLHALHELMLWQAGQAEPDGEIRRREAVVNIVEFGGAVGMEDGAHPAAHVRTQASTRVTRNLMERDEDQSDRDLTRKRRVSRQLEPDTRVSPGKD